MGIISLNNKDRLYWLGRYSERVYTTIRFFGESFDTLIDRELRSVDNFCARLDIPAIYTSGDDFVEHYCFDLQDPNSIISNLTRAFDNAVELREEIGSEPVSYVQMALYVMNSARGVPAPMMELQRVVDDILAFWGVADDMIADENVRNIIKVGKRIERLDLFARLHRPQEDMKREYYRLADRVRKTDLRYDPTLLEELRLLIEAGEMDYRGIVWRVDRLLEA